jgi:hypothetical protein
MVKSLPGRFQWSVQIASAKSILRGCPVVEKLLIAGSCAQSLLPVTAQFPGWEQSKDRQAPLFYAKLFMNLTMTRILCLLILLVPAFTSSADVLIYRVTERVKYTGLGNEGTTTYKGYWIVDPGATNVAVIRWNETQGNKHYFQEVLRRPILTRVDGKGHSSTYLTESLFGVDRDWSTHTFAKGLNQTLPIATGRTAGYPRTLSASGSQIGPYRLQGNIALEISASFVYAQPLTITHNDAGHDIPTILSSMSVQLEQQGYSLSGGQ